MEHITVQPKSRNAIKQIADKIREIFDIRNEAVPIVAMIEYMSSLGEGGTPMMGVEIVKDEELPGNYAEYRPATNMLIVRESVYNGACNGNGRDRFTLAHELGHFILHKNVAYGFARGSERIASYIDPEWQANTFASMLLIPREEIHGMDEEEIAAKYLVSKQAARIAMKK